MSFTVFTLTADAMRAASYAKLAAAERADPTFAEVIDPLADAIDQLAQAVRVLDPNSTTIRGGYSNTVEDAAREARDVVPPAPVRRINGHLVEDPPRPDEV